MVQCLIKLKPVTCQSPYLPSIHLVVSSIKNDTRVQRSALSARRTWSLFTSTRTHQWRTKLTDEMDTCLLWRNVLLLSSEENKS